MAGEGAKGEREGEGEMREGVSVVGVENASRDVVETDEKVRGLEGGEREVLMNTATCVHGEREEGGESKMETDGEAVSGGLRGEEADSQTEEHGTAISEQSNTVTTLSGDEGTLVTGGGGGGGGGGGAVDGAAGVGVGVSEKVEGAAGVGVNESEGYQKIEFATLFYHATTGYYYDPVCILYMYVYFVCLGCT